MVDSVGRNSGGGRLQDATRAWLQFALAFSTTLVGGLWWASGLDHRISNLEDFVLEHDDRRDAVVGEWRDEARELRAEIKLLRSEMDVLSTSAPAGIRVNEEHLQSLHRRLDALEARQEVLKQLGDVLDTLSQKVDRSNDLQMNRWQQGMGGPRMR